MTNGAIEIAPFGEEVSARKGDFRKIQGLNSPALRGFIAKRPESEANGGDRRVGRHWS